MFTQTTFAKIIHIKTPKKIPAEKPNNIQFKDHDHENLQLVEY